jgi:hypothetical protein
MKPDVAIEFFMFHTFFEYKILYDVFKDPTQIFLNFSQSVSEVLQHNNDAI